MVPNYSALVQLGTYVGQNYQVTSNGFIIVDAVHNNANSAWLYINDSEIYRWLANSTTFGERRSVCIPVSTGDKVKLVADGTGTFSLNHYWFMPCKIM